MREQPRKDCLVDEVDVGCAPWRGRRGRRIEALPFGDRPQLLVEVLPLAHAQVVKKLPLAQASKGAAAQRFLFFAEVVPQEQVAGKVAALRLEPGMLLVGLGLLVGRPFPGVLNREGRDDDEDFPRAPEPICLDEHPAQPRIERQRGECATDRGQPLAWTSPPRAAR